MKAENEEINALNHQEGGSHYKDMPIQPIEYIFKNELGYREIYQQMAQKR